MNNDLISRSALRNAILNDSKLDGANVNWEVNRILVHIDNAPTVDCIEFNRAEELIKQAYQKGKDIRPQGEWIKWNFKTFGAMGDWEYKCSNCEKVYGGEYNFCPNCGAQMKECDLMNNEEAIKFIEPLTEFEGDENYIRKSTNG